MAAKIRHGRTDGKPFFSQYSRNSPGLVISVFEGQESAADKVRGRFPGQAAIEGQAVRTAVKG